MSPKPALDVCYPRDLVRNRSAERPTEATVGQRWETPKMHLMASLSRPGGAVQTPSGRLVTHRTVEPAPTRATSAKPSHSDARLTTTRDQNPNDERDDHARERSG